VLPITVALASAASCSNEQAAPKFEPECTVNQFRACQTDACRGAQQCVEPGLWSACSCVVLDASYPDVLLEAGDSASEASEAGAEAGPDALLDGDADSTLDADLDAPADSEADASD
jgi:hypothetical protein